MRQLASYFPDRNSNNSITSISMALFDPSSIFQAIVDENWDEVLRVASTEACKCKDDLDFLPLHVALQDEAPENVQLAIIQKYPEGGESTHMLVVLQSLS